MSSMDSSVPLNTTFDPFTQTFTLLFQDGTPFNVTIPDLDDFILYSVQICINYAAQLGASLILLIVLALLTKPEKRTSPVFILNSISLALNFIRNVLQCLYFTGPFSEVYAYFSQDYSRVPQSAYSTSVAATVFTFLLLVCIEVSLLLQTQVVCVTLRKFYRQTVFLLSAAVALLAIAFRLALCISNARATYGLTTLVSLTWLTSTTNIVTSISIFWFSVVFLTKLGFALHQRRKFGLRRFGPMQIIFIMGCQTLIIPAIFSIIEYFVGIPSVYSNVLTLVAIFLPLSSMWASSSVDGRTQASSEPQGPRKYLISSYKTNSTNDSTDRKPFNSPLSPADSELTRVNHSSSTTPVHNRFGNGMVDIEAQALAIAKAGHL